MRASRLIQPFAILALATLWTPPALAQAARAGVVTTVQGQATVARAVRPQPVPLRFRDELFLRDRVETGENSLVRVLLGGKAVVTVRELSIFTVTEEPGRAAVELRSGRLALGVAKRLLKPGEAIEIRTPNAVAGVRGSLVLAEVKVIGGVPLSTFTALEATLPITVSPESDPSVTVTLGPNDTVGVSGLGAATVVGPVLSITPGQAREAALTAEAPRPPEQSTSSPLQGQISAAKLAEATRLASLLAPAPESAATPGPVEGPTGPGTTEATTLDAGLGEATLSVALSTSELSIPGFDIIRYAPISTGDLSVQTDAVQARASELTGVGTTTGGGDGETTAAGGSASPGGDQGTIPGTVLNLGPGQHLLTFSVTTTRTVSSPAVHITESQVSGVDSLFLVESGADATLAGSLLLMTGTSIETSRLATASSVLEANGRLATTTDSTLLDISSTSVIAGDLVRVGGGGHLALAGPLLTDAGGVYSISSSLLSVFPGGQVTLSSADPLVSLTGGTHSLASLAGGAMFLLLGRSTATAVDTESRLTLGTDRPLQGPLQGDGTRPVTASLLETTGATVTGQGILRVSDAELLLATAPLLSAKAGSLLTTTADAVDLSLRANVSSLGTELIRLDGSMLTVTSGALVTVAGGSKLTLSRVNGAGGDLLQLRNGATLNILNGPLLNVTGGSFASIAGALVSFVGTGNTVNVTNNLAPTGFVNGVPVFSSLGGAAGFAFTSATSLPGLNLLGNTITINNQVLPTGATPSSGITGSLIAIQGSGTVKIGPVAGPR
jgi:hypothetical protein